MHLTLTFPVQSSGRFFTRGNVRGYRFGFNGQMKDDEVYGEGNSYTAEYWQYDPRLGRRWNVDKYHAKYSYLSPYAAFENNPISIVDKAGDSTVYFMKGKIIHISHDNLPNAIVHLVAVNDIGEQMILSHLDAIKAAGKSDDKDANEFARSKGTVYMMDGINRFNKESENAPRVNSKWGDKVESGARLYKNGNIITVGSDITFSNSPSRIDDNQYPPYNSAEGEYQYRTIHGHNNAGETGWPFGISDEDARFLGSNENEIFNIVSDKNYLYFNNPNPPGFGDQNYQPIAFSLKYLFDDRTEGNSGLYQKLQQQSISGEKSESAEKNLGIK